MSAAADQAPASNGLAGPAPAASEPADQAPASSAAAGRAPASSGSAGPAPAESEPAGEAVAPDPWAHWRGLTPARVALGRAGASLPTRELLAFGCAHAQARDAVHLPLDVPALAARIKALGPAVQRVRSAAPDRATYLLRPDLGRRLDTASAAALDALDPPACDLLLVVGDGLSSAAVERQAVPVIERVLQRCPAGWRLGPVVLAEQARVALGDDIGQRLRARCVAVLIGERPGLSSPDSLGIYLTHAPRVGRTDAERNCLSNVRPEGLSHDEAARKLLWLAREALRLQLTGVGLKDLSDVRALDAQ
ncbi:ethanolamine ammonia-lyase subunit EutC [Eleftheria terrae]|uniref:ethanolamine ammonia-lyase subunit EutC n=1 Tax=Eleftheria terrae TaxID=1597781 RepID=UPI00263A42D0|nr:ethanolamine ammonia-lyase subunit EutC [Eleftheria terrae]WKB51276.1 ethanolamine ammonia-lyase subunit EutC [Eleftheria terrae]